MCQLIHLCANKTVFVFCFLRMSEELPRGNREYVRYQLENDLPNFDVKFSPQFQKNCKFSMGSQIQPIFSPKVSKKMSPNLFHHKISNFRRFCQITLFPLKFLIKICKFCLPHWEPEFFIFYILSNVY